MLKNDTCPYTLLEVGKTDASRSMEDTRDADKVSSKYLTPFNHRMMQSSMDLYQVQMVIILWPLVSTNQKWKIISLEEEASVGKQEQKEQELQELHFSRSISPSPLPQARLWRISLSYYYCQSSRFIRMAGKELILGPPWRNYWYCLPHPFAIFLCFLYVEI